MIYVHTPAVPQEAGITVEIKNRNPVELEDLTRSLLSFADEYKRFMATHSDPLLEEDVRLYVKEIRPGSIIADLTPYAPLALRLRRTLITSSNS